MQESSLAHFDTESPAHQNKNKVHTYSVPLPCNTEHGKVPSYTGSGGDFYNYMRRAAQR